MSHLSKCPASVISKRLALVSFRIVECPSSVCAQLLPPPHPPPSFDSPLLIPPPSLPISALPPRLPSLLSILSLPFLPHIPHIPHIPHSPLSPHSPHSPHIPHITGADRSAGRSIGRSADSSIDSADCTTDYYAGPSPPLHAHNRPHVCQMLPLPLSHPIPSHSIPS